MRRATARHTAAVGVPAVSTAIQRSSDPARIETVSGAERVRDERVRLQGVGSFRPDHQRCRGLEVTGQRRDVGSRAEPAVISNGGGREPAPGHFDVTQRLARRLDVTLRNGKVHVDGGQDDLY